MSVKSNETTTFAVVFADGTPASPEYLDRETALSRARDIGARHIRQTFTRVIETTTGIAAKRKK